MTGCHPVQWLHPSAPYSLTTTQCWYYTYDACLRAAGKQGVCIIKQKEARSSFDGDTSFCVVTAYGTHCWYYNAESCRRAAEQRHGVCAVNSERLVARNQADKEGVGPFTPDPIGRQTPVGLLTVMRLGKLNKKYFLVKKKALRFGTSQRGRRALQGSVAFGESTLLR